jgi:hypothetical protein
MKKKVKWHQENEHLVFKIMKGECRHCLITCKTVKEGSVHHTTYKPVDGVSVYDLNLKKLFELEIIEWVCHKCHNEIHETVSIDGITKIWGTCFMCNKRRGHKERAKLLNIDKPMCIICFRRLRKIRNMRNNGQGTLF